MGLQHCSSEVKVVTANLQSRGLVYMETHNNGTFLLQPDDRYEKLLLGEILNFFHKSFITEKEFENTRGNSLFVVFFLM